MEEEDGIGEQNLIQSVCQSRVCVHGWYHERGAVGITDKGFPPVHPKAQVMCFSGTGELRIMNFGWAAWEAGEHCGASNSMLGCCCCLFVLK